MPPSREPPPIDAEGTRPPSRGTQLLRAAHRQQVTELLRVHGPLSRTEVAERLGLTRSAVTAIVSQLIDDGILHELDTPASGRDQAARGRPRVLVGCRPAAASVVGVQIGARRARVVLADAAGQVVDRDQLDVHGATPRTVIDQVARSASRLGRQHSAARLATVGVCVPGSVDTTTGTVLRSDVLGWDGVAVADMLGDRLGVPAFAQDVTQAATLAEALYGAAAGATNAMVLDYGGRIGVGLIVDGRLYRGSSGLAGSIGHTPVFGDATPCRCGRSGCIEAVAGLRAMTSAAAGATSDHAPTHLDTASEHAPADDLTDQGSAHEDDTGAFASVVERARGGDPAARAAVARALDHGAHVTTTLVGLLDPDVLVLTGLIDRFPDFATDLERRIVALTPPERAGRLSIRTSTLGREAWVKGAVLVALQQLQPHVRGILEGNDPARRRSG